jgi:hypothetical protein
MQQDALVALAVKLQQLADRLDWRDSQKAVAVQSKARQVGPYSNAAQGKEEVALVLVIRLITKLQRPQRR